MGCAPALVGVLAVTSLRVFASPVGADVPGGPKTVGYISCWKMFCFSTCLTHSEISGFLSRLRESLGKERPRVQRRIGFAFANRCGFFVVCGIASFAAPESGEREI